MKQIFSFVNLDGGVNMRATYKADSSVFSLCPKRRKIYPVLYSVGLFRENCH